MATEDFHLCLPALRKTIRIQTVVYWYAPNNILGPKCFDPCIALPLDYGWPAWCGADLSPEITSELGWIDPLLVTPIDTTSNLSVFSNLSST